MASSLRTKLRIAASVLFATGFFDAVAGRFLWAPGARRGTGEKEQQRFKDLAGALHVHSTYSDGASDIPTVMEAAREAGVDFVLLTDHNTQRPLRDGWEQKYAGQTPFLLIGTEITVEHGAFLLALDMPQEWEPIKHETPQITIDRVLKESGMPLVSLPFDVKHPWRDWDASGYMGLEVLNVSTVARRHINLLSLAWLVPLGKLGGTMAALRALLTRPDQALDRWDSLTRGGQRQVVGIGSLDAHALMKIGKKKYPIPSYADSFRTATTHVLVPEEGMTSQGAAVYEAIREGRCYFVYDCLARPTEFVFSATNGAGNHAEMGERLQSNRDTPLRFRAQVAVEEGRGAKNSHPNLLLRLLRDGMVIASQTGGSLEYTEERALPGAYRVEAYLYSGRVGPLFLGARPWIFGNPIYVSETGG